jgi:hypothetical protein
VGLELLREADMILDACGRPEPPPGYNFVDLPRAFGYTIAAVSVCVGVPFTAPSERVQNKATTLFLVEGIAIQPGSTPRFNIRFPSGRLFNKMPTGIDGSSGGSLWTPTGYGSQMYKLCEPEPIPADARITVSTFGGFSLYIAFWGKLRYLVADKSSARSGAVSCIIGYPSQAKESGGRSLADLPTMANPIPRLAALPRYPCTTPNGNILAPETLLGNQCTPEVPDGRRHNSYTLVSDPITVATGRASNNNAVLIPGNDDVILRRVRVHTVRSDDEGSSNIPTFALRHPSGYSVTGGDQIPVAYDQQWFYLFPSVRCKAGDRLILDVSNVGPGTSGSLTTTFEFDGVKEVGDQ